MFNKPQLSILATIFLIGFFCFVFLSPALSENKLKTPTSTPSISKSAQTEPGEAGENSGYAPDQFIVDFNGGTSEGEKLRIMSEYGTSKLIKGETNMYVVYIKNEMTVKAAIKKIEKEKSVNFAEPNYLRYDAFSPSSRTYTIKDILQTLTPNPTATPVKK